MVDRRLVNELAESKKYIVGNVFCQWIRLLMNVAIVVSLSMYFQSIMTGTPIISLSSTIIICVICIGIRMIAIIKANRYGFASVEHVKFSLRDRFYKKLLQFGSRYHEKMKTSEMIQVAVEGVEQLETYVGRYVPQYYYCMVAPLTLVVIISSFSLKTALILLLWIPLMPLAIVAFRMIAKKKMKRFWGSYTSLGNVFLENLQGLTTLKIYEADEMKHQEMNTLSEKFRLATMRVLRMQLNSIILMNLLTFGGIVLAIILAVSELTTGSIQLWQAFTIVLLAYEIFIPMRLLGSFFHIAMNGAVASDKLFNLLDMEVPQPSENVEINESLSNDHFYMNNIHFSYEDLKPTLKNISLKVKKGGFTSIVGKSGSGKSTLANIMTGQLRNYEGEFFVNGVNNQSLTDEERYKLITVVTHDNYIFKGTIRSNLLIGKRDCSESEMLSALEKVKLKDFVVSQGGLDMVITEQGSNLSGGQKQRLAIARAFLHDSPIYIFDEATSNIDMESENAIIEFIHQELVGKKTVVLISHRLANVVNSDNILVMKDGCIVESGTFDELMTTKEIFKEMYEKQMELENYAKGVKVNE